MDDHPFSCINVRFEGEEGTGPGVNRGFFTGFASVLKSKLVQVSYRVNTYACVRRS